MEPPARNETKKNDNDNDKQKRLAMACFSFEELCNADRGAMDFRAIARNFDIVVIRNVPRMSGTAAGENEHNHDHNRARRFITLMDELYEAKCALLLECRQESSKDEDTNLSSDIITSPMELFAPKQDDTTTAATTTEDYSSTDQDGNKNVGNNDDFGTMLWVDVAQQGGVPVSALASVRELDFAFERASSRIHELCSQEWWNRVLS
mmetsp:Transcript_22359/g.36076  ORF Transcript_22359/g.36076 Transcript_22359/m.36076 type:complete len:207 (-) Transcript_22359:1023-1643(-)